jgi:hypothetical protein
MVQEGIVEDRLDSDCRRAARHIILMRGAEAAECASKRAGDLRAANYVAAAQIWDRIVLVIKAIEAEYEIAKRLRAGVEIRPDRFGR